LFKHAADAGDAVRPREQISEGVRAAAEPGALDRVAHNQPTDPPERSAPGTALVSGASEKSAPPSAG
jgi:hypothetical protein